MSHFMVLVVGGDPHKALAPFHQFECTGLNDEFVQEIDVTEETRQAWLSHEKPLLRHMETGEEVEAYDERFYRTPTEQEKLENRIMGGMGGNGKGLTWDSREWSNGKYETRIYDPGAVWEKAAVQGEAARSFLEYATEYQGKPKLLEGHEPDLNEEHKFGYVLVDAQDNVLKVIDRTNPNYKWDWYQIGGRWSGIFKLKPGRQGHLGERSLLDREPDKRGQDQADIFLKGDVDWEAMRDEKEAWATKKYHAARELLDQFPDHKPFIKLQDELMVAARLPLPGNKWDGWTPEHGKVLDRARDAYHKQPSVQALKAYFDHPDDELKALAWDGLDEYVNATLEGLVKEARDGAGITHAVLYNGQWNEVGEMGWFGCVSDEKASWPEEFRKLIDSLPDYTVLTVVDCHI